MIHVGWMNSIDSDCFAHCYVFRSEPCFLLLLKSMSGFAWDDQSSCRICDDQSSVQLATPAHEMLLNTCLQVDCSRWCWYSRPFDQFNLPISDPVLFQWRSTMESYEYVLFLSNLVSNPIVPRRKCWVSLAHPEADKVAANSRCLSVCNSFRSVDAVNSDHRGLGGGINGILFPNVIVLSRVNWVSLAYPEAGKVLASSRCLSVCNSFWSVDAVNSDYLFQRSWQIIEIDIFDILVCIFVIFFHYCIASFVYFVFSAVFPSIIFVLYFFLPIRFYRSSSMGGVGISPR